MSEKIESKAKTANEIAGTIDWDNVPDRIMEPIARELWVPLKEAQKLEKVIEGYEKALQKITAIAEEDEDKIAKANEILGGHCSGYYHCHNGSYDELKEILEAKQP